MVERSLASRRDELLRALLEEEGLRPPVCQQIPSRTASGPAPLSYSQESIWLAHQLDPEGAAYNQPSAVLLDPEVELRLLRACLQEVVDRHETLRTRFVLVDDRPTQIVTDRWRLEIPVVDLERLEGRERDRMTTALISREFRRPFNLERGPLMRSTLLFLSGGKRVLLTTIHHIAADDWAMGIFVNEVAELYGARAEGRAPSLPGSPIGYVDYAVWQRERVDDAGLQNLMSYWRRKLDGELPILELPFDRPRPAVSSEAAGEWRWLMSPSLFQDLESLSRRQNVSLYMTLLAGFKAVLCRTSGVTDLVVGSPVANRDRPELEGLIGCFVNTLILRSDLSGNPSFRYLLGRVSATCVEALERQELPFELLIRELSPSRDLSAHPIIQAMFSFQNASPGNPDAAAEGLLFRPLDVEGEVTSFDLTLDLSRTEESLFGHFTYKAELFDATTIGRLSGHLEVLLAGAVEEPDLPLSALPVMSRGELHQLTFEWNDTEIEETGALLHELFEAQARAHPDRVAVVWGERRLTYGELERRSSDLALRLALRDLGPEARALILTGRSLDLPVALLGTLKAGAAFVPVDPNEPAARLALLVADCSPAAVIVGGDCGLPSAGIPVESVLRLDREERWNGGPPARAWAGGGSPLAAAYVIYTSGSTGRPKGAIIPHRAAAAFASRMADSLGLRPDDGVLQFAPLGFDVLIEEIFPAWASGATVVLSAAEGVPSFPALEEDLLRGPVTVAELPAAYWSFWTAELDRSGRSAAAGLRRLLIGTEAPRPEALARWRSWGPPLAGVYGLTETTVTTTVGRCGTPCSGRVPLDVGRPLAGARVRIVDGDLAPVAAGVLGEVLIAGEALLGRGYLNRPAATAQRWVPDPESARSGDRAFRTGDLGRLLADGRLELHGRRDEQVKVHGVRVELGEVEAALARLDGVREAAVVARRDAEGGTRLDAYLVSPRSRSKVGGLRDELRRRLPSAMLPASFTFVEQLPRTASGKLDRRRLPASEPGSSRARYEPPQGVVEKQIASIWAEVLELEQVGRSDDFFSLGGHSLIATQVISRIRRKLSVELPLRRFFEAPTVAALANAIRGGESGDQPPPLPPVEPVDRGAPLPLSFSQQRLWLFDQLEPGRPIYNVPTSLRLVGSIEVAALAAALREIVDRHEVLRTTFALAENRPVQVIAPRGDVDLEVLDLQSLDLEDAEDCARELAFREAQTPFDLAQGPLLRVRLIRMGSGDHVLLVTMHHIVSDDWTLELLLNEVVSLYSARLRGDALSLPPPELQYADFAVWQRRWLAGEILAGQLDYWRRALDGAPDLLRLPIDRPRPARPRYRGAALELEVGAESAAAIRGLCRESRATLYMALLAAFYATLYRLTGQEDICIGTGVANRRRLEFEELFGFFVNTVVLRVCQDAETTFRELLGHVRAIVLGAHSHQDLPFELLLEELAIERDKPHSPLFQVMFEFENAPRKIWRVPGLELRPFETGTRTAKFDLVLAMGEGRSGFRGVLEYDLDLFDHSTAQQLTESYVRVIDGVAMEPDLRLIDLPLGHPLHSTESLPNDSGEQFAFEVGAGPGRE